MTKIRDRLKKNHTLAQKFDSDLRGSVKKIPALPNASIDDSMNRNQRSLTGEEEKESAERWRRALDVVRSIDDLTKVIGECQQPTQQQALSPGQGLRSRTGTIARALIIIKAFAAQILLQPVSEELLASRETLPIHSTLFALGAPLTHRSSPAPCCRHALSTESFLLAPHRSSFFFFCRKPEK